MQKLFGFGLGAAGIVSVLVVAGILLTKLNVSELLGNLSIFGGILIGLALGTLGVFSVVKRVFG